MSPGDHIPDAMRRFTGNVARGRAYALTTDGGESSGPFYFELNGNYAPCDKSGTPTKGVQVIFDPSRVVPTSYENCPASLSYLACTTY